MLEREPVSIESMGVIDEESTRLLVMNYAVLEDGVDHSTSSLHIFQVDSGAGKRLG
jgi:hypothetical protein